jgi:hypothetical protein
MNGHYIDSQLSEARESVKQLARNRVLHHLSRFQPRRPYLLSTPGERWPFEHQYNAAFDGKAYFTGLEWTWGILERGLPWMPKWDRRARFTDWPLRIGTIQGAATDLARWLYIHASSFFTLQARQAYRPSYRQAYDRQWRCHTAAWLDLNTNCSSELHDSLRGLYRYLSKRTPVVPVAVTFIAGQERSELCDGDTTLERRVPLVKDWLEKAGHRKAKVIDAWQYESYRGCHMVNVLADLHAK